MSAALISARICLPGKKQRLTLVGLWVRRCIGSGKLVNSQRPELEGARAPLLPTKREKIRTRRGARGRRCEARSHAQHAISARKTASGDGSRRKAGGGSRRRHLLASLERSVERAIPVAQQCLDIKRRAEERRAENPERVRAGLAKLVPMPPKAAEGLERRQTRLRKSSDFWGKAWSAATGIPPEYGRRYWRDLLFKKSLAQKRKGVLFAESVDLYDGGSRPVEKSILGQVGEETLEVKERRTAFLECGSMKSCGWYTWVDGPVLIELESCPGCAGNMISYDQPLGKPPKGWHR